MNRAQMVERVTTPREDSTALPPILEGLTPDQAAAVTHGEEPLLVAGAGRGKTTVITRRIACLVAAKRARPDICKCSYWVFREICPSTAYQEGD